MKFVMQNWLTPQTGSHETIMSVKKNSQYDVFKVLYRAALHYNFNVLLNVM